jgi:hypothetical protein
MNQKDPKLNWSFPEIIHAGIIIISYHTLSDFCHAVGLNVEISDLKGSLYNTSEESLPTLKSMKELESENQRKFS